MIWGVSMNKNSTLVAVVALSFSQLLIAQPAVAQKELVIEKNVKVITKKKASRTKTVVSPAGVSGCEKLVKKIETVIANIDKVHGPSIDNLRPFSKKKTYEEDEAIEKEIHHRVRKMSREPGFLKAFFLTEFAEQDVRCPFIWYLRQVGKSVGIVKRYKKIIKAKLKKLATVESFVKTTAANVKECIEYTKELKRFDSDLEDLLGGLILLQRFIEQSDSFLKESQSRPSITAQNKSIFGNVMDALAGNSNRR